jgi:hypothetical protein
MVDKNKNPTVLTEKQIQDILVINGIVSHRKIAKIFGISKKILRAILYPAMQDRREALQKILHIYVDNKEDAINSANGATKGHAARNNNKRASKLGIEGTISKEEWFAIIESQDHKCLTCGKIPLKLTMDHIIPISKGGTNMKDNVQALCYPCNYEKGDSILSD